MTAPPSSGQFTMVDPAHVAEVGPAAALLYGRIVWRSQQTGTWRATRRQLRDETGLTDAMLRTAVAVLRSREWVTADRTSSEDATLIWRPLLASDLHVDDSAPPPVESAPPPGSSTPTPPVESAMSSYETGKTYPLPPAGGDEPDLFGTEVGPRETPPPDPLAGFDEWWSLYPHKVAKGDARKAWATVTKRTTPEVITAGLRRQVRDLTDAKERGFCPYPATWLRRERWEDEAPTNVHPIRRDAPPSAWGTEYDPEWERQLPPPPADPLVRGGW